MTVRTMGDRDREHEGTGPGWPSVSARCSTRRSGRGENASTSTPATVSSNRGLALLDEVIEHIERSPQWVQTDYRCGSGMCVAGWAAQMAGGTWAFSPDEAPAYLVAEHDDPQEDICAYRGVPVVHAHDRASRLLELTQAEAFDLFSATNSVEDIRSIRNDMASRA